MIYLRVFYGDGALINRFNCVYDAGGIRCFCDLPVLRKMKLAVEEDADYDVKRMSR